MMRVAERCYYFTEQEVTEKVRATLRVLRGAEVPTEYRAKAFELVFSRLTEQHVQLEAISPAGVVLNHQRPQG